MRAAVKEKLSQLGESLDSAAAEIEACRSSQKDSDKIVAELCSDVAILKDLLPESSDSLADEIFSLKSRLEEVEGAAAAFAENPARAMGPRTAGTAKLSMNRRQRLLPRAPTECSPARSRPPKIQRVLSKIHLNIQA